MDHGGVLLWAEETSSSLEEILRSGAVALLPVGAIEPHGPHLPLAADVVIAEEMALRASRLLFARQVRCVQLPSITYSIADWSAGFPGSVSLSAGTARGLIRDVCLGAYSSGLLRVAIANAHLEPAHIACLRQACADVAEAGRPAPVFPDVTRRGLAERLGEAFLAGDHAGRYETSLLMAARPELVREQARASLPAVDVSLVEKIRQGARSFRGVGMDRAYCGDPAKASTAEGEKLLDILARILEAAVMEALDRAPARNGS